MRVALWAVFLLLCSCTTPVGITVCLPLTSYTSAQQAALAARLGSLTSDDPLFLAVADYERMRDADRACINPAKP